MKFADVFLSKRISSLAVALAFGTALLSFTHRAAAYCAARTCDPDRSSCDLDPETGCSIEGTELARPDGCVYFAVQKGKAESLGLRDAELEHAIEEAFEAWRAVDCGDGSPSLEIHSLGMVGAAEPFACLAAPERNIDTWLLSTELTGDDVITASTGATAGATRPSFIRETGEVFDADVLLNQLWFLVQREENIAPFLRVVALHEAGHALGLAHSLDEDALMYRDYRVTADRTLTQDDIDGICALFPPDRELACESREKTAAAFDADACEDAASMMDDDDHAPAEESGCSVRQPSETRAGGFELLAIAIAALAFFRSHPRRLPLVACVLLMLGCNAAGETPQSAQVRQNAVPDPAAPSDPELVARLNQLAGACDFSAATGRLSCQGEAIEELAVEFLNGKRARIPALPTLARTLRGPDEKLRAITAQLLSLGFSVKLGDDLALGAIDKDVGAAMLDALRKLPLDQARKITPVSVHVAMLSGQYRELQAVVAARADAELQRMAYRRMMVHGRLAALPEIKVLAQGADSQLAAAAVEALRNMSHWTAEEQDVLCPFALSLLDHPDAARAARATQALMSCSEEHVDAMLARARALHTRGKLDNVHLVGFMDVCKRPEDVATGRCVASLDFLQSIADDDQSSSRLRTGALSTIAHQIIDDAQAKAIPSLEPDRMLKLLKKLQRDRDPEVAKYSGRMLEHLLLTRTANRTEAHAAARATP